MDRDERKRLERVIADQKKKLRDPNLTPEERIILMDWIEELEGQLDE